MVDIQSATAEIRWGIKKRRKKQDKNIMSASAMQGGHKNRCMRERHGYCTRMIIITARRSYASAVLGVVILSVRLSHACFVTDAKNLPAIFLYHILITANMQSNTGFPSSHQLKSYVALKSRLKFAARCPAFLLLKTYSWHLQEMNSTEILWAVNCFRHFRKKK